MLQRRAWVAFFRLIRRTANFLRNMKQEKIVNLFSNFLKNQASECEDEQTAATPTTAVVTLPKQHGGWMKKL